MAGPKYTRAKGPIGGPKTATSGVANPFEVPSSPSTVPTKSDLTFGDLAKKLRKGEPIGSYTADAPHIILSESDPSLANTDRETLTPGDDPYSVKLYMPNPISENTSHLQALRALTEHLTNRVDGIVAASNEGRYAGTLDSQGELTNQTEKKSLPTQQLLNKASRHLDTAYAAHAHGDAITSTHHVQLGAQAIIDAINHHESGNVFGGKTELGNKVSSNLNWRAPKGADDLASGDVHSKVALIVNEYSKHIKDVAKNNPKIARQLSDSVLEPVSYNKATSKDISPLYTEPKTPEPKDSEDNEPLQPSERMPTMADYEGKGPGRAMGGYRLQAKKQAEKLIGKTLANGKVYTKEDFDAEHGETLPPSEYPKGNTVIGKIPNWASPGYTGPKPARNIGYSGSLALDENGKTRSIENYNPTYAESGVTSIHETDPDAPEATPSEENQEAPEFTAKHHAAAARAASDHWHKTNNITKKENPVTGEMEYNYGKKLLTWIGSTANNRPANYLYENKLPIPGGIPGERKIKGDVKLPGNLEELDDTPVSRASKLGAAFRGE